MIGELTNHLWQSTLFAIVAGLLTLAFRRNRAQVRYWIWLSASLKFFIPFSLLISLGSHLEWTGATKRIAPAVALRMLQIAQPFPGSLQPALSDWLVIAILGVWACGFVAVALMRLRGWLRIRAALRSSVPVGPALARREPPERRLQARLPAPLFEPPANCGAANLGCRRLSGGAGVELRSSPGLLEPGIVGFFRPILLLPEGIEGHLTQPQLNALLAHELCHVRRRDNLCASIHMIAEAMFWFLPRVWWVGAGLLEERERACDEEVLNLGNEPQAYAEAILNLCKLYVESPLACVSGITGSNLKQRIEAIMTPRIVLRLNLTKKVALLAAGIAALAGPIAVGILNAPLIQAQSTPKFDVASIRLGCGGGGGRAGDGKTKGGAIPRSSPGRLSVCGPLAESVGGLIPQAYGRFAGGRYNPPWAVPSVEGGPDWIHSDFYSISARAEDGTSLEMMNGPLLQALLEDRFKLKVHRETREAPVYALTVAKGGSKMQPFKEGSCVPIDFAKVPFVQPEPGQKNCNGMVGGFLKAPNITVDAQGSALEVITFLLGLTLDRPVIDKTGLTGRFDIHLEFAADQSSPAMLTSPPPPPGGAPAAAPSDPTGPSIFTAIQEQLGLKLEPAKALREFLVIDHVERPSEN